MTKITLEEYTEENYDTLREEFIDYLVSECGYSRTIAEESDDGFDEFCKEYYEQEYGKYTNLISSIADTYTQAEIADVDVKVSVYGVDMKSIKFYAKKYKGDIGKNKEFTSAIIPFGFGKILLFDKKA